MSKSSSTLSLAALQEILAAVERSIAIFERAGRSLLDPDDQVGAKLRNLRLQLREQIEEHPDNRGRRP